MGHFDVVHFGRCYWLSGADPELLPGGGHQSLGGHLPNTLIIFSEKPYEIKEILVHRGHMPGVPPKSATGC